MAKKLRFRRTKGMYRHKHKDGRQRTYRKGDIIKIDDASELGGGLNKWEEVKEEKIELPEIRVIKRRKKELTPIAINETKLPKKAADGVKTEGFVRDVDLVVNDTLRNTWLDPETGKVYWMDESGYLSPMNEDDTAPKGKDGEVIGEIESDDPPLGLIAVNIGNDLYNVINEKTQEAINDNPLRLSEAEALIDGKIVESSEDMAKE